MTNLIDAILIAFGLGIGIWGLYTYLESNDIHRTRRGVLGQTVGIILGLIGFLDFLARNPNSGGF